MRFALLGDHPDGVETASALVASGRHQVVAYSAALPEEVRGRLGGRRVADLEEVLADPEVEAVIVAGAPDRRAEQLRRALQSERHVLCVHPAEQTPELAYQAGMMRDDVGVALLPLLPAALHPAVRRLADFVRRGKRDDGPVGAFVLLEMEIAVEDDPLAEPEAVRKPALPGWDVLRALGGEAAEVCGFAADEELTADRPALLAGRFVQGGLFRTALLPARPGPRWRLNVVGARGEAELLFPVGVRGPAFLGWRDDAGGWREESWEPFDPWSALVERFEAALGPHRKPLSPSEKTAFSRTPEAGPAAAPPEAGGADGPSWQDEVRCLELDDAARRSVQRRRASAMEYPEPSEEVGFKGAMTLVGCGVLWVCLLLLIASRWVPWVGWLAAPVLFVFLVLQLLRWVIPSRDER
jgi:predicted dehydrogenase